VVQVSAHYPPNFVSGGTLVPQRIAQQLAERGHEVAVYAGHLDEARPPLSTWQETDEHGVLVRWISTTPWTSWSDEHNFRNDAVAADFAGWLAERRPDVVHLHSLQTLGGELVRLARASGARVVVTMHDFWWVCARQFLVDRDVHPCSLVVDCGACACQVDHEWLLERNRWLADQLVDADVVLVPSASAAAVLAANGVAGDRLRVAENGVPDVTAVHVEGEPDASAPGIAGGPTDGAVRLMFAGGADPMKGLPVLLAALDRVRLDVPWEIDLYNVDRPVAHPRVHARPAFAPAQLAAVLAGHDVLVLPSVMRESHSLMTREALGAGLAVICTDSLGPEEVVDEGVNGLVVPADDPVALAAALDRVVGDRALLADLRAHTAGFSTTTVAEQVAGLERLYTELVGAAPEPAATPGPGGLDSPVRRVLFIAGIEGAPLRYRAHLPAEALAARGLTTWVRHYRDPQVRALAAQADAVVLYRVPATRQIAELIGELRAGGRVVPVLSDVDDLIIDPQLRGQVHGLEGLDEAATALWWHGVARYRTTVELSDGYIGSTATLCEQVGRLTGLPTYRFDNGVGRVLARVSEAASARPRRPGPLRIGYFSGTTTHDEDWAMVEPAVVEVLSTHPGTELWLGGHLHTGPALAPYARRVRRLPMLPWTSLPGILRQVDVNLAPLLPGSVFNEAKSAIKWLEAALVGTPTVASPTGPFVDAVEDGITGYLADAAPQWVAALTALLDDEQLRARTGARARRAALLRWSPARQAAVYLRILDTAWQRAADGGPVRTSTWEPVLDDEPWDAAAHLLAYPPRTSRWSRWPGARQASQVRALVRVVRAEGAVGAARAVRRRLRRH
jgi:glycosyltransferase involved in cell wall biosynthesis